MSQFVFVVDDSNTNLALAKNALSEQYEVITINSLTQMFKLLERIIPEAILADIQMPGFDPGEFMEHLQSNSHWAAIKVIFMSEENCPELESHCYKAGCVDFIAMPFDNERLLARVMNCTQKSKSKPTVLIIDDSAIIISALGRILRPFYRVLAARDGESGLKQAQKHDINLILLDISMPNMSGFDVIRQLKAVESTSDIPVIFITSSEKPEDQVEGLAEGAVDFIRKPFLQAQVLKRIELHVKKGDAR